MCVIVHRSWRSVKPLLRCGDFSIFKTAAVSHLGFLKVQVLIVSSVGLAKMRYYTKFHCDLLNGYSVMAI